MPPSDGAAFGVTIAREITPDAAGVDALHALLSALWRRFPAGNRPSPSWQATFTTAVGEIVSNIIRHSIVPGDTDARIHIEAGRANGTLHVTLTNPGRPFVEPAPPPVPAAEREDALDFIDIPEGSYGLALARACLDTLDYERTSDLNIWTLTKHL